jgi:quercetin dioxygenase-like cupin family protein
MTDSETKPIDSRLVATPFSYADTVAFQDGAVVSRTIINKPAGTVTVFAFDKGERLSTHSAPFDALLQVVEGSGRVTIEEKVFTVRAPESIIMPANRPHSVVADERFKMVLVMIKSKNG